MPLSAPLEACIGPNGGAEMRPDFCPPCQVSPGHFFITKSDLAQYSVGQCMQIPRCALCNKSANAGHLDSKAHKGWLTWSEPVRRTQVNATRAVHSFPPFAQLPPAWDVDLSAAARHLEAPR